MNKNYGNVFIAENNATTLSIPILILTIEISLIIITYAVWSAKKYSKQQKDVKDAITEKFMYYIKESHTVIIA